MRSIDASVTRFLMAGMVNTGLTYGTYLLLLQVSPYGVAFTIAFVLGIFLSYLLNTRFVFRRPASWRSFFRFPLIYIAQYLLGLLLVSFCVEWMNMAEWLAPLIALVVTIPLSYLLSRALFIGRRQS
jgi:putative flippase GtrA